MSRIILLQPKAEDAGKRIDSYVCEQTDSLTRSAVQRLCGEGRVLADGKPVAKSYRLRGGEALCLEVPSAKPMEAQPQDIPLDIVYEDAALIVVNKPKGIVVHPAAGNEDGTLVNALLYHCAGELSGIGGVIRPGIVHRIDKDTSGLLAVAKTDAAHLSLSKQIKAHQFTRIYHAVAHGKLPADTGAIDAPIGRHPADRKKMCVTDKSARAAVTHYEVLARYEGYTYLAARLETGRTHQIRVHLRYIGHPLAGDTVYGSRKAIASLNGQCLHAKTLGFVHPMTGKYMEFDSELPSYFTAFLKRLRPL